MIKDLKIITLVCAFSVPCFGMLTRFNSLIGSKASIARLFNVGVGYAPKIGQQRSFATTSQESKAGFNDLVERTVFTTKFARPLDVDRAFEKLQRMGGLRTSDCSIMIQSMKGEFNKAIADLKSKIGSCTELTQACDLMVERYELEVKLKKLNLLVFGVCGLFSFTSNLDALSRDTDILESLKLLAASGRQFMIFCCPRMLLANVEKKILDFADSWKKFSEWKKDAEKLKLAHCQTAFVVQHQIEHQIKALAAAGFKEISFIKKVYIRQTPKSGSSGVVCGDLALALTLFDGTLFIQIDSMLLEDIEKGHHSAQRLEWLLYHELGHVIFSLTGRETDGNNYHIDYEKLLKSRAPEKERRSMREKIWAEERFADNIANIMTSERGLKYALREYSLRLQRLGFLKNVRCYWSNLLSEKLDKESIRLWESWLEHGNLDVHPTFSFRCHAIIEELKKRLEKCLKKRESIEDTIQRLLRVD